MGANGRSVVRDYMLKRFTVSNFKNFGHELSFVLDNPANYGFNAEAVRNGVKTKGLIYGINGSGKSNLGLALFDIIIHLTDKERMQPKYYPYLNLGSKRPVAEFEYVFEFDGCEVVYRYAKTSATDLVYERLAIGGTTVLSYDFANRRGCVELVGAESLQITSSLPGATDVLSRVKFVRNNAILQDDATNRAFVSFMTFVERMLMFYSLDQNGYQVSCALLLLVHQVFRDFLRIHRRVRRLLPLRARGADRTHAQGPYRYPGVPDDPQHRFAV